MAEITAKLVNELRSKSGQAMMECKKALVETGGDVAAALDYFRKKGVKTSITERSANEGRVGVKVAPDGKRAAIVEVNCNTDFTAKSEPVAALLDKAASLLLQNPDATVNDNAEVVALITATAQGTGENVKIGKAAALSNANGKVGGYLYAISGKIGVIMSLTGNPSDELITDLGGHIAFSNPLAQTRSELDPTVVAKEREIAVEQAKATGKPQQIAEKIAEGKLGSFYKERVLLDQDFFNPGKFKGTIMDLLKQNNCTLEKYIRVQVGA